MSAGVALGEMLVNAIPGGLRAIQALPVNDRQGVDWWVETAAGERVGVDCKIREVDPLQKFGKDDLALETWSVIENNTVGWTLNDTKRTDYVLWIWKDTGRWCLVPFLLLVRAFKANKEKWIQKFQVAKQNTEGKYHSECVFVPRKEVWREIYRQSHGEMKPTTRIVCTTNYHVETVIIPRFLPGQNNAKCS